MIFSTYFVLYLNCSINILLDGLSRNEAIVVLQSEGVELLPSMPSPALSSPQVVPISTAPSAAALTAAEVAAGVSRSTLEDIEDAREPVFDS